MAFEESGDVVECKENLGLGLGLQFEKRSGDRVVLDNEVGEQGTKTPREERIL